ncbi:unnamed protein product [Moneuplotes crassus]|uniref:Uncharacterized protein n=1 Tax=Euplotes crassus TaxID=5936 RepID=A0AAD1UFQ7_EUPCR|nr:unnamed protein product [Moneuplotes crassus]
MGYRFQTDISVRFISKFGSDLNRLMEQIFNFILKTFPSRVVCCCSYLACVDILMLMLNLTTSFCVNSAFFTKRERICFYKVFMPFINLKRRVCDAIV